MNGAAQKEVRMRPPENLVGKVFGQLQVVQLLKYDGRQKSLWLCLCQCGTSRAVTAANLKYGKTTNCGCGRELRLSGQTFGKWTVIRQARQQNETGKIVWLCHCACGNEGLVKGTALRKGRSQSCGCLRSERGHEVAADLRGLIVGRLTVFEFSERRGKVRFWKCRCTCGNIKFASAGSLARGNVKSCGCLLKERHDKRASALQGQRFGRLVAISYEKVEGVRPYLWLCFCDCGAKKHFETRALIDGMVLSCGCFARDQRRNTAKDIEGLVFGRLTVEQRVHNERGSRDGARWLCRCECGTVKTLLGSRLRRGLLVSCGCAVTNRDPALRSPALKARFRVSDQRSRAKRRESGGSFTVQDVDNRFRWQRGRCAMPWCRIKLHDDYELDHIIPLSPRRRNGLKLPNLNDRRNTQLLCEPCNRSKSDKDPIEHSRQHGFLL